ncbi:MAG: sigma-70 family RNA polymerase sigma factor [Bacteroidetes bacterium]|nr:MAG: sigma-70 family RNA polymerase sigma factor [Bacteroidota bacterium]
MDELQHIRAIGQGDRKAFEALYRRYADRVYNTALGFAKNAEDAEEITQDVFVRIWRGAQAFKGEAAVHTWIYRITVNAALSFLKKKEKHAAVSSGEGLPDGATFDHPGARLENKEKARLLFQVIDTLPDNQRTAFLLSYVEHLPRQEVADVMGLSLKAVESLLQRAKQNLRKRLEPLYPQ